LGQIGDSREDLSLFVDTADLIWHLIRFIFYASASEYIRLGTTAKTWRTGE